MVNSIDKGKSVKFNRKDYMKVYNKEWAVTHKGYFYALNKTKRVQNREFIQRYKLYCGCKVCGYKKCAGALDFHHIKDKAFNIAHAVVRARHLLKQEIRKCIVLCRNCHYELHYGDKK